MTRHEAVIEFACVIDTVHAAAYTFPFSSGRPAVSPRNVFRNDLVKRLHLLLTPVFIIHKPIIHSKHSYKVSTKKLQVQCRDTLHTTRDNLVTLYNLKSCTQNVQYCLN